MEYNCVLCKKTLVDPVETSCCHALICEPCVDSNADAKCDLCGEVMTSAPTPNIPIRRIVGALPTKCPYVEYGCTAKVIMSTVRLHAADCGCGPALCMWSERGCAEPIRRKDQGSHESQRCQYRDLKCPNCPAFMQARYLKHHDDFDCPGSMVECPVKCGVLLARAMVPDHLSRCRLHPAACPYRQYGCKAPLMSREQLPLHMATEAHAHLILLDAQYAKVQRRLEQISLQQSILPELHRWNVSTLQCVGTLLRHTQSVLSLTMCDGRIISGGEDGLVVLWDVSKGVAEYTLNHLHAVTAVCCLGDTVFTGQSNNTLQMWSLITKEVVVSTDLRLGTPTDTTGIWRIIPCELPAAFLLTKPELAALLRHEFDACGVQSESHQATFPALLVASGDGIIYIVERQTLVVVDRIKGHNGAVTSLALEGTTLCSGGADGTIRVWDLSTCPLTCVRVLSGHTDSVNSITYVREGVLLSGSGDSTVRCWMVQTGEALAVLEGHTSGVQCVCRVDRSTFVSGGWDQKMFVWSLDGMRSVSEVTCSVVCAVMNAQILFVGGTMNSIKMYTTQSLSMDRDIPSNIKTRQSQAVS